MPLNALRIGLALLDGLLVDLEHQLNRQPFHAHSPLRNTLQQAQETLQELDQLLANNVR